MERQRFAVLDSWRGICAILVALNHFNADSHIYNTWFVQDTWLFVDFFFVLSGFVIGYAYSDRLADWGNAGEFVIRRFGRLWPLHVAMLAPLIGIELVKLAAAIFGGYAVDRPPFGEERNSPLSILTNLLLIHSLGVHDALTWNYPSWSISTEFYTYIVFATAFVLVRDATARLIAAAALSAGGAIVVLLCSDQAMQTTYDFGIFRCFYGFFIGYLTYRLWCSGTFRVDETTPVVRSVLEIGAVALVIVFVETTSVDPRSFAAPLLFAAVVFIFAGESGPVSRVLLTRPAMLLGAWSYSIYMVHQPLVEFFDRGLKFVEKLSGIPLTVERMVPWEPEPVELIFVGNRWLMDGLEIAYVIAIIALASLTYRYIEQPGRAFFNRLASRERPAPGSAWNAEPARAAGSGREATTVRGRTTAGLPRR